MRSVVFDTPGSIDIRSFTNFGVNVKPLTTSPIGFFGTGLKYAIAVLVREGLKVELWIGADKKYTFYDSKFKFRDKDFTSIRMKRETFDWNIRNWIKPNYIELPYTTELGKTWKLWEAFRELYTNTIDEGGETYVYRPFTTGREDHTRIQVTGESFVQEFFDKDRNFLPDGLRQRQGTDRLQVFERPSNYLYYRGMRVYDLEKPSTLTYNFLCDISLSENRQAAAPYFLKEEIARYLLECENEEQIKKVLLGEDSYESNLNYSWAYRAPSSTFIRAARSVTPTNSTALGVVRSYEPRKHVTNPLERWPRPWVIAPYLASGKWVINDASDNILAVIDLHEGLNSEAMRYIQALLNKDLEDDEFDTWVRDRPKDLVVTDTEYEAELREAEEDEEIFVPYEEDEEIRY